MPRTAALASLKPADKLTSNTSCQSSSLMRINKLSRVRPALLTRISMRPSFSSTLATRFLTSSALVRLAVKTSTLSPSSALSLSIGSSRISVKAKVAPCLCKVRAILSPKPPAAPVMRATLSCNSNICHILSGCAFGVPRAIFSASGAHVLLCTLRSGSENYNSIHLKNPSLFPLLGLIL